MAYKNNDNETLMTLFDEEGNTVFEDEVVEDTDLETVVGDDSIELSFGNLENSHLEIGSTLASKYVIKRVLGQGGLGIAYLAVETSSKNEVVIKEFFPKKIVRRSDDSQVFLALDATEHELKNYQLMKKVFEEESQNLVTVNRTKQHKNVVGFSFAEANVNNTYYFAMPYSKGEELLTYLERKKEEGVKLSQEEIMEIIEPVLRGLSHIHLYGIFHKDIKPANIFMREHDEPMLIDFGASVTSANLLTRAYAPIEQVNKRVKDYGPYTDIYAVGVMMYEMVTGQLPPKSETRAEAIAKGDSDPYVPLTSEKQKGFENYFLEGIDKAMSLAYTDRPKTAEKFREILVGDLKRKRIKKLITLISSIVLILVAIAGVGYELLRERPGTLLLNTMDNVKVFIDDFPVEPIKEGSKGMKFKVEEGKHIVTIKKDNFVNKQEEIVIQEGKINPLEITLIPDSVTFNVQTYDDKGIPLKTEIMVDNDEPISSQDEKITKLYPKESNASKEGNQGIKQKFRIQAKAEGYLSSKMKILTYEQLLAQKNVKLTLIKKEGKIEFKNPKGWNIAIDSKQGLKDTSGNYYKIPITIPNIAAGQHKIVLYSIETKSFGDKTVPVYSPIEVLSPTVEHNKTLIVDEEGAFSKSYKETKKKFKEREKELKEKEKELLELSKNRNEPAEVTVLVNVIKPELASVNGLSIGKTEVTYNELVRFLNSSKPSVAQLKKYFYVSGTSVARYINRKKDDNNVINYYVSDNFKAYPVAYISWVGAKAYANWLSQKSGKQYRLPTVEEWESVASIGFDESSLSKYANYLENGIGIEVVKGKKATKAGVYDILGNVAEWCEDKVGSYERAVRGGSYKVSKEYINPTQENSMNEKSVRVQDISDIGFRLVLDK